MAIRTEPTPNEWSWISGTGNRGPWLRYIVVLVKKLGIERGDQVRYVERFARNMNHPVHYIGSGAGDVRVKAINVRKPLEDCNATELAYIARALEKVVGNHGGQDHE